MFVFEQCGQHLSLLAKCLQMLFLFIRFHHFKSPTKLLTISHNQKTNIFDKIAQYIHSCFPYSIQQICQIEIFRLLFLI